jgi:putative addiction module component (TIGR02574 family)
MTQDTAPWLEQALRLHEQERADLVARLLDSLDPVAEENVAEAWSQEVQERLEELDRGKVQPLPWSEARRMIQDPSDDASVTLPAPPRRQGSPKSAPLAVSRFFWPFRQRS